MRSIRWIALAGLLMPAACVSVPYHAKRDLGRRVMQMDTHPLEEAIQNKIRSAREVSGGRPGNSAGGGCGCGN